MSAPPPTTIRFGSLESNDAKAFSQMVEAGKQSGNINVVTAESEHMDFSESSKAAKQQNTDLLRQLEAKRRARTIMVPTDDLAVRKRLRLLSEPMTLFGEAAPERRERLRELMSQLAAEGSERLANAEAKERELRSEVAYEIAVEKAYDEEGSEELVEVRKQIFRFGVPRAAQRLHEARTKRQQEMSDEALLREDHQVYLDRRTELKEFVNSYSVIADIRPISSLHFAPDSQTLATASWSGDCKVWDIRTAGEIGLLKGHTERVTDIAFHPSATTNGWSADSVNLASCGADETLRLWALPALGKVKKEEAEEAEDVKMKEDENSSSTNSSDESSSSSSMNGGSEPKVKEEENSGETDDSSSSSSTALPENGMRPLLTLRGHADRLCRLAWHPSGRLVATSSFDTTWRLWDVEAGRSVLCQTGHSRALYGIGMHPDGTLLVTGDLGGQSLLWDLRVGRWIMQLNGHSKQVLSCEFSPTGYHAATAGGDNTVRLWDIRNKKTLYVLPAHSKLISSAKFHPVHGQFLYSSSYDGTCKLWSCVDFRLIKTLAGPGGRMLKADMSPDAQSIATASFDRTWKLWRYDET
eukprot:g44364.t1